MIRLFVLALLLFLLAGCFGDENAPVQRNLSPGTFATIDDQPTQGTVKKIHDKTLRDGKLWAVKTFQNAKGELCGGEVVPGEGEAVGCDDPASRFKGGPLVVNVGSNQDPGVTPFRLTPQLETATAA